MTDRSTTMRVLVLNSLLALAAPLAALAQNNNGAATSIPTLDGVGFATLAGALAMAGSWVVLRRKRGGDE